MEWATSINRFNLSIQWNPHRIHLFLKDRLRYDVLQSTLSYLSFHFKWKEIPFPAYSWPLFPWNDLRLKTKPNKFLTTSIVDELMRIDGRYIIHSFLWTYESICTNAELLSPRKHSYVTNRPFINRKQLFNSYVYIFDCLYPYDRI